MRWPVAEAAYADARALVLEAFEGLLPPERLDVPSWAERDRWMNNAGGGYVGPFSHEVAPYIRAPQRCLTMLKYLTTAIVGPGQVAKTVAAENWLGHSIVTDPADFLWYMQSDDGLESYVKGRINPFIDEHECLLSRRGTRSVDDSLHFKRFRGMRAEFLPFGPRTIINKSAARIVADEIDNYQWLGDVKPVLDVRRQTFGRQSMVLAMSHPDLARGLDPAKDWTAGIMAFYGDSTRFIWCWKCPHCGAWSSPVPIAPRVMTLEYVSDEDATLDDVEASAHLLCPVNGCVIGDEHRAAMNLEAYRQPGTFDGWIGDGQEMAEDGTVTGELIERDTAGFWIVGAMSPFVLGGIGGLARERVKAERARDADGDDASLRQVIVKQWGFPYSPRRAVGSVEARDLVERCEALLQLGQIAHGVRFLTFAVDSQIWGWDWLVRGWGANGESWIVDYGRLAQRPDGTKVDPATSAEDWDLLLELFARTYPLADGSGRVMKIRAMAFDSQGQPGVTTQAYGAFKRWRKAGKTRHLGTVGRRDVWTIIPTKGSKGLNAPKLIVSYPDTNRAANKAAARGEVPQAQFNPNIFKDELTGQLKRAQPGDWFVHFPAALRSKSEPHTFFEQMVAERQLPNGSWEKIRSGARNEVLDLMVLSHVAAHLHGLTRIDWSSPPAWAADWNDNPNVFNPVVMAAEAAAAQQGSDAARRIADRLA